MFIHGAHHAIFRIIFYLLTVVVAKFQALKHLLVWTQMMLAFRSDAIFIWELHDWQGGCKQVNVHRLLSEFLERVFLYVVHQVI